MIEVDPDFHTDHWFPVWLKQGSLRLVILSGYQTRQNMDLVIGLPNLETFPQHFRRDI